MTIAYYAYLVLTVVMLFVFLYEAFPLHRAGMTKIPLPIYLISGTVLILFWPVILFALAVTVFAMIAITLLLGDEAKK